MNVRTETFWIAAVIIPATAVYVASAGAGWPAAGGLVGHLVGVAGLLVMLFAWLGYSWRKRETRSGPGTMQQWLQGHVIAGVVGPYLVLLHSAFEFRGLAGILSLLVLIVVLSGLTGRYVFTSLPPADKDGEHVDRLRSRSALWWLLHVPLAAAMIALTFAHVLGALYYSTLLR
ncbi:MAG TPA: hypothetical protein VFO52_06670 [Longimicrobiales bacterium]|nr:hypothetical protein [Longimicrobiales bacterium]